MKVTGRGFCFTSYAELVPTVQNVEAGGISRLDRAFVSTVLAIGYPNVSGRQYDLEIGGRGLCSCALAWGSSGISLLNRLSLLIWSILDLDANFGG